LVSNSAAPDANIIFGAVIDDALGDEVRVTVIAAGFDEGGNRRARPARAASSFAADPAPAAVPAADTYRAPAPPVPADVWAAPSEPVNEPEPQPVSFSIGENGSLSADSPGPEGSGSAGSRSAGAASGGAAEDNAIGDVPAPRPADTSPADSGPATPVSRPDTAAAARVFDAATTRRRSVVFEEDDELDVPDFLK
jgi:cell division protein FtsZ